MTLHPRIRVCPQHKLRPRCPACEADYKAHGDWPQLECRPGTAEWILRAARFYAEMGDEGAVEFAIWLSVDLREVADVA